MAKENAHLINKRAFHLALALIFRTEQEIRYVHGLDPLVISPGKFVRCKNIFGIVVVYFKQPLILPFFRFFRIDLLYDLNINFLMDVLKPKIRKSSFNIKNKKYFFENKI